MRRKRTPRAQDEAAIVKPLAPAGRNADFHSIQIQGTKDLKL